MTPTWATTQAAELDRGTKAVPAPARPRRAWPPGIAVILLSVLATVALLLVFSPLANAVGGCGGG